MESAARDALAKLDAQQGALVAKLTQWCAINSGSDNLAGLAQMAALLGAEFSPLADKTETIELPPAERIDSQGKSMPRPLGRALRFHKRPGAPRRVLLAIHYDTVYSPADAFQSATIVDGTLNGPGAADAKGGILVMRSAIAAAEAIGLPADFGWDVILNPDEEIGSPGSGAVFAETAARCGAALLFEPSQSDGKLVSARKGSGVFSVVVHGKSAHAGRDFELGRSAILAAARMINAIDDEARRLVAGGAGITINCGRIEGGGAVNAVPDLAIARFNTRAQSAGEDKIVADIFARTIAKLNQEDGIRAELHGSFSSPPKPLDDRQLPLFTAVRECGKELGMAIDWKPSGGACDGNRLAALGLPVVDSLGPVGGRLHSPQEYVDVASIVPRIKLATLVLLRLADPAMYQTITGRI